MCSKCLLIIVPSLSTGCGKFSSLLPMRPKTCSMGKTSRDSHSSLQKILKLPLQYGVEYYLLKILHSQDLRQYTIRTVDGLVLLTTLTKNFQIKNLPFFFKYQSSTPWFTICLTEKLKNSNSSFWVCQFLCQYDN